MNAPSNLPFAPVPTPGPTPPPAPSVPPAPAAPIKIVTPPSEAMQKMAMPAPAAPVPPPPTRPVSPSSSKADPEDIFSNLEQPKKPSDRMTPPTAMPNTGGGGVGKFLIIVLIILVVAALLGFGFWFFLVRDKNVGSIPVSPATLIDDQSSLLQNGKGPTSTDVEPSTSLIEPVPALIVDATSSVSIPPPIVTPPEGSNIPSPQSIQDTPIAPTEPVDTDKDRLTDDRERELGTDPGVVDTDGDGLSDGDEIEMYGTNPINKDTDGDGYKDGDEIKNGYNPRGPGKCSKADCTVS